MSQEKIRNMQERLLVYGDPRMIVVRLGRDVVVTSGDNNHGGLPSGQPPKHNDELFR